MNWSRFKKMQLCSHHLISEHEHGLEGELSTAVVEEVLEAGSEKINHHHIILSLHTEPLQVRNASFKREQTNISQLNFTIDQPIQLH